MGNINVRGIDDNLKRQFRRVAAAKGRSMEAELRDMIMKAVNVPPEARNIGKEIMDLFDEIGGVELEIPPRTADRQLPDFGE
jgi:antitoxin FitA